MRYLDELMVYSNFHEFVFEVVSILKSNMYTHYARLCSVRFRHVCYAIMCGYFRSVGDNCKFCVTLHYSMRAAGTETVFPKSNSKEAENYVSCQSK